ncbi:MAG: hypothetical protein CPSOU_2062 [uncultured Paraburkholderia sp.]|nr:MAG: hypothetical protein CPSOU_2062 [uncultured Paraburkholderia sp.]
MSEHSKGSIDTEQRLMQIIASHAIKHPGKKLLKWELAAAAGITRQALHRYYGHLEPYISGEKSVSEELDDDGKNTALSTGIERLKILEAELVSLKAGKDKEIARVRAEYVTSLMKSDLALHDVDGLRARLEAQSLHNDILINQIKSLEAELTALKLARRDAAPAQNAALGTVMACDVNLKKIFTAYQGSDDTTKFEEEKLKAVLEAFARAKKVGPADATIVVFIERYLCSFEFFCKNFHGRRSGNFVIVRTPIFNALQLKTLVLSKLSVDSPVKIFLPYCESKSVAKAQRAFYFPYVPEHEIAIADKIQGMSISDPRVDEIVTYRITQGE